MGLDLTVFRRNIFPRKGAVAADYGVDPDTGQRSSLNPAFDLSLDDTVAISERIGNLAHVCRLRDDLEELGQPFPALAALLENAFAAGTVLEPRVVAALKEEAARLSAVASDCSLLANLADQILRVIAVSQVEGNPPTL